MMDLESECSGSALESIEDNDEVTTESALHVDEISDKAENDYESHGNEIPSTSSKQNVDSESLAVDLKAKKDVARGSPPPATTKGYGLKKWRRIKRDFIRDSSPNIDTSKILKRSSSSSSTNRARPHHSIEANQSSEGSVGSVNMLAGSNLDARAAIGPNFSVGMNSGDNSEDRSSKSSTAASIPKLNVQEDNRMRNLSGKANSNSAQRIGKGRAEASKKPKGERIKIKKENSHSSMESDSRSSNFVFLQGASSLVDWNGKQIRRSTNHDGENTDEDPTSGNHPSSTDEDPLDESVIMLQSLQEALEKEVKKLGEVGREGNSSCETSFSGSNSPSPSNFSNSDPRNHEPTSSDQCPNGTRQSASSSLGTQALTLEKSVHFLESKLEAASLMVKAKGSRLVELEAALSSNKSQMGESASAAKDLQQEKWKEMESEVEALFRQKIESEIECVAITHKLRVATEGQEKHSRLLGKIREAECKIERLKKQAEDWEMRYRADVLRTEEVLRMEKRVFRVGFCFFVQLLSLAVVCGLLILRSPPHSGEATPT